MNFVTHPQSIPRMDGETGILRPDASSQHVVVLSHITHRHNVREQTLQCPEVILDLIGRTVTGDMFFTNAGVEGSHCAPQVAFTLSRIPAPRAGFRYRNVLSKSECPSHDWTVR